MLLVKSGAKACNVAAWTWLLLVQLLVVRM